MHVETIRKEQTAQIIHIAGKITILADRLAESEECAKHDKTISALRKTVKGIVHQKQGTKGTLTISEFLAPEPCENIFRRMHGTLEYLHTEINAAALLRDIDKFDIPLKTEQSAGGSIDAKKAATIYRKAMIKSRLRNIARELGLAPPLALSMAQVESGFNHQAVSPRGAIGVLQIMPALASERFEVDPETLFDPEINIRVGLLHMKDLLERFNHNLDLSLAAYNAGTRRVILAGYKVPAITETREYIRKVKEAMNDYAALVTPGLACEPSVF